MGNLPEMMVQEMDSTFHPIKYSIMPSDTHSFIHTDPGVTSYTARAAEKSLLGAGVLSKMHPFTVIFGAVDSVIAWVR